MGVHFDPSRGWSVKVPSLGTNLTPSGMRHPAAFLFLILYVPPRSMGDLVILSPHPAQRKDLKSLLRRKSLTEMVLLIHSQIGTVRPTIFLMNSFSLNTLIYQAAFWGFLAGGLASLARGLWIGWQGRRRARYREALIARILMIGAR